MRLLTLLGLACIPLGLLLERDGPLIAGVMVLSSQLSYAITDRRLARQAQRAPSQDDDAPGPPPSDDAPHVWRLHG